MVIVLLMVLFLALVAFGLWAYAHSLLTDAAAQAARYGAAADATGDVSVRAAEIMSHTIAGSSAGTVRCTAPMAADAALVEVHCTMAAPGIASILVGLLPDVDVTAHALREVP